MTRKSSGGSMRSITRRIAGTRISKRSRGAGSNVIAPVRIAARTCALGSGISNPNVVRRGQIAAGIAGVHSPGRLDQHDLALVFRERFVLFSTRHDEHLAGSQLHAAVAELDRQLAVDDEEHLVRLRMA